MVEAAALVLAAGASSRLGRPKQLVEWGGRPLLERVVAATLAWPVTRVVVVLGSDAEDVLERVDLGGADAAINEGWEEGIASSLRVGLDVLSREASVDWAFVALGDQPRIPVDVPGGLLDAAEYCGYPAVVPHYRYQRGNPVLVNRSLWQRMMALSGDIGAAPMLTAHPDLVEEVHFDHVPPRDVDTAADLADLRAGSGFDDPPTPSGR